MNVILVCSLLFGLALADLSCECGKRNAGRIIGGKEARKNEYPWIVAFQTKYSSFTTCGGAIVTPWHIVTAAHCVTGKEASDLVLIAGAHDVNDLDGNTQRILIDEIIMHPQYNNFTNVNDIAVLKTSNEITYNDYVGPVCMPIKELGDDELKGKMVKAMGWGRYVPDKPNMDKRKFLREVDIEVQSVYACRGAKGKRVCTYTPKKDTCRGDSGGPLIWLDPAVNRFVIVAVVSFGPAECGNSDGRPGVNTNVSWYREWINDTILRTKNTAKTCHQV